MSNLIFFILIVIGFSIFYSLGIYLDNWWKKKNFENGIALTDENEPNHAGYLVCIYLVFTSLLSGALLYYGFIG